MIEGVDYSFTRPDIAALAARGYAFAGRYVGLGTTNKLLTRGEALDLNRHGLRVVTLAEADARGALGGMGAGVEHAARSSLGAAAAGAPPGAPIYFAVDFQPTPGEMSTVGAYFKGVGEVIPVGQIGAYGGYDTIAYLFSNNLIGWGFQTYAWSHGRWHPWAKLRQLNNHVPFGGGLVDICEAVDPDYGGWTVDGLPLPGEDETMTREEQAAFHIQRWRLWELQLGHDPIVVPAWPALDVEETHEPNWMARTLRAIATHVGLVENPAGEWEKPQVTGLDLVRGSLPVDLEPSHSSGEDMSDRRL